jgi:hypothetical protein
LFLLLNALKSTPPLPLANMGGSPYPLLATPAYHIARWCPLNASPLFCRTAALLRSRNASRKVCLSSSSTTALLLLLLLLLLLQTVFVFLLSTRFSAVLLLLLPPMPALPAGMLL